VVYSELFSAVKVYLDRPNLPQADFNALLPGVEGELQRALVEHPRNISRGSYTQLAGDAFLPLPVNLVALIGLYLNSVPLAQFPADMREAAAEEGGFIQKGACLELFPAPTSDTIFRMDYHATLPVLDPLTSASTNWVLTLYPDLYIYGCLREAAIYLRDDQRLGIWGAEFGRRITSLVQQGWGQGWATPPKIRVR